MQPPVDAVSCGTATFNMDPLLISAASGMKARMESLDMLANNIANAGTVGFKADREFYGVLEPGLFQTPSQAPAAADSAAGASPTPSSLPALTALSLRNGAPGQLPLIEKHWTDFSQGMLLPTGNQLDLALDGEGFFALNRPASSPAVTTAVTTGAAAENGDPGSPIPAGANTAPTNDIVYSRSGRFQILRTNQLGTAEGFTLRNTLDQGRPITVNPSLTVEVAGDGTVTQESRVLGRIEIGGIADPAQSLAKMGSSYFARLTPQASGPNGTATTANVGVVKQGTLEQSNVGATDASVRLVGLMRQFEMMQRAMALGTEMNKRALDEVARFS